MVPNILFRPILFKFVARMNLEIANRVFCNTTRGCFYFHFIREFSGINFPRFLLFKLYLPKMHDFLHISKFEKHFIVPLAQWLLMFNCAAVQLSDFMFLFVLYFRNCLWLSFS